MHGHAGPTDVLLRSIQQDRVVSADAWRSLERVQTSWKRQAGIMNRRSTLQQNRYRSHAIHDDCTSCFPFVSRSLYEGNQTAVLGYPYFQDSSNYLCVVYGQAQTDNDAIRHVTYLSVDGWYFCSCLLYNQFFLAVLSGILSHCGSNTGPILNNKAM